MTLEIGILGPLIARADGRPLTVAEGRRRSLLLLLALRAPEVVSADVVLEALWPGADRERGVRSLQVTVSRLRSDLGPASASLETAGAGYRLRLAPDALDAQHFERLLADATRAGEPRAARELLEQALALWRGPPLSDVEYESFAQAEIGRLEELRLVALEERIEAQLAIGEDRLLVGELERLVADHPGRERFLGQLMRALYRCGRQTDALAVFRDGRRHLNEELGLEPSPELRRLEAAVLRQDPSLDAPVETDAARGRRSVPLPATPIVARAADVDAVAYLLVDERQRLVTLTGPGGVGKTRLALELSHRLSDRFDDGSAFVSLAEVAEPDDVPSRIAAALGVQPTPGEAIPDALVRYCGGPGMLLVLDNFEHVLEAAPLVGQLLAECRELSVLATSREPLRLRGEHVHGVVPLATPPPDASPDELETVPAAALFLARARARRPLTIDPGAAAAVSAICRRLDGLPLALELAAAHLALRSPEQLAARLDDALAILTRGPRDAPERHRTLRAAIDWSHQLLDPDERAAFARFTVFPGGATPDAAVEVTGAALETFEALLDRGLLQTALSTGDEPRLRMLVTIRAYALERLAAAPERDELHERHAEWCLRFAEDAERELNGAAAGVWMSRVASELPNLRAAIRWWSGRDPTRALRLATALGEYWSRVGPAEGEQILGQAAANADDEIPIAIRARAWLAYSRLFGSDPLKNIAATLPALGLYQQIGDERGIAACLVEQAMSNTQLENRPRARELAEQALTLARGADDAIVAADAELVLAIVADDPDELLARAAEAEKLLVELGRQDRLAQLLGVVGCIYIDRGAPAEARTWLARTRAIVESRGNLNDLASTFGNEGLAALLDGDEDAAETALRRELALATQLRTPTLITEALHGLAVVAAVRHVDEPAARLLGAAEAAAEGKWTGMPGEARLRQLVASARERLGAERWRELYEEGRRTTIEDATRLAERSSLRGAVVPGGSAPSLS
jgi:predicted ATPase/DNA-binding SARP family transcriptional activator